MPKPQASSLKPMRRGFTLLEMSIVIIILALVAGLWLTAKSAMKDDDARATTEEHLQQIQDALLKYRKINFRLPCPASGAEQPSSANFGVEAGSAGACGALVGVVPNKTLGLGDDIAYDGWQRRITYAAAAIATQSCATKTYPLSDATAGLTVNDSNSVPRTQAAWYVLVAHGPNGHGAYLPSGLQFEMGANAAELENSDADDVFVDQVARATPGNAQDVYDDTVRYATRAQLRSAADENSAQGDTCP